MKNTKEEKWMQTYCFDLTDEEFGAENIRLATHISDSLVPLFNEVLLQVLKGDETIKELKQEVKLRGRALKQKAKEAQMEDLWDRENNEIDDEEWLERGYDQEVIKEHRDYVDEIAKLYSENKVTAFDHNYHYAQENLEAIGCTAPYVNISAGLRRGAIKNCHGAVDSWRKHLATGDYKSKPPGQQEVGKFYMLRCEPGCAVTKDRKNVRISLGDRKSSPVFELPGLDNSKNKPLHMLLRSDAKVKSFTLSRRSARNPDKKESDLQKPGVWRISINFELPLPEKKPATEYNTVALVIGSNYLGVALHDSERNFPLNLPLPHKHWFPIIGDIEGRANVPWRKKGSKKWRRKMFGVQKKHSGGRQACYRYMARQQKQGEYETIADHLIGCGVHFVVSKPSINHPKGLADASAPDRGGDTGPNRIISSTGVNSLVLKLKQKVKEFGGSVTEMEAPPLPERFRFWDSGPKKVIVAQLLRNQYLAQKK
ncbi:MAG: hypothetical protein A3C50_02095 [Candidatus Staskawiczbacteria bacterium RIFCSPHIGHO2_02_FULL_43_16]|uniref:Uncharacterized protein n=1 Tax=Candidatus Staskawiczbacteria bacterium RIFCSPHIGHO2_01_FULL_41_41 TaxID=1802203 RepID=A0A1G2HVS3_9BACT|nr:MAG: hypothetical protein A2822_00465 [Candidatus Staskawiczbacteria bacterium RIFCSPHIGHO2_01_FULL_41_41]OGZ68469.1 MAG: hypothetical protein A3C50_02095 [Candidatus Staskawiczbacteria bacterium RIFCSPHIGHO2_02_FULL_43_16]OGZ74274.1 MAG: hypothetical protein A3A12_02535 [Candidatus Staskawiczbacteria bacterium RIFCSPLOWO2_01_FULL_43_17b]